MGSDGSYPPLAPLAEREISPQVPEPRELGGAEGLPAVRHRHPPSSSISGRPQSRLGASSQGAKDATFCRPNPSLSPLHSHRNAWANLRLLGQPNNLTPSRCQEPLMYVNLFGLLCGIQGDSSPGRESQSVTTLYISLATIHTKYTGRRQTDSNARAHQATSGWGPAWRGS